MLNDYFKSPNLIFKFFKETGLDKIFQNKNINNLVDYVFGIEVGLDSNARKNRSGEIMSKIVSDVFNRKNIHYEKEISSKNFPEIINLGFDIKHFDFVIKTNKTIYLIETNFYNVGGSKLNEIARSYSELSLKINQNKNFEFVWITDGQGWLFAKNKLEEAFNTIDNIYNLTSTKDFINKIQKEILL